MLVAVIVIAVIGIIPVIIRKKFLKIYLTLLQKNDIKGIFTFKCLSKIKR